MTVIVMWQAEIFHYIKYYICIQYTQYKTDVWYVPIKSIYYLYVCLGDEPRPMC